MTGRILLTEDNIVILGEGDLMIPVLDITNVSDRKIKAEQLKQQILEDQEKADNYDDVLMSLSCETMDELQNKLMCLVRYKQENKQLKEQLQNTRNEVISDLKILMSHKQKLEKIKEFMKDKPYWSDIQEILESK